MSKARDKTFEKLFQEIQACHQVEGINQLDILNLPAPLDTVLNSITRQGSITLSDFAGQLSLSQDQAARLSDMLVEKGYLLMVQSDNDPSFKINFAHTRKRRVPTGLFDALDF